MIVVFILRKIGLVFIILKIKKNYTLVVVMTKKITSERKNKSKPS